MISNALPTAGYRRLLAAVSRILIVFLAVVASCDLAFSQIASDVRVRVLDYRTGRPAGGRKVGLMIVPTNAKDGKWVVAMTGRDGVASFRILGALPQTLRVDPEAGVLANWSCTTRRVLDLSASDVLRRGFVGELTNHPFCRHHTSSTPVPRPGEIVVYIRRLNAWLAFRRLTHEAFNG